MRSSSAATIAALAAAPDQGLVPRDFVWVTAKDRDTGLPVEIGFWSGDYPITIDVISGTTGAEVERDYIGGVNLQVGDIAYVSDLSIQSVDVKLSAISDDVQQLVRGYDPRLAQVEIHSGFLDTTTRQPVDPPEIDFLGEIDGSPIETAATGGDSSITLKVRSDAISMLTRTNPRRRSHEGQKRRSGDEFARYANATGTWQVPWGVERQRNEERG